MNGREIASISGASMGIGKELAKISAADGRDYSVNNAGFGANGACAELSLRS